MPTTSNFGWTTPADTDLVKDGAAAIRTLGNGIDASLVDLKGGTTNQVLAKNSNTDLDFKWVADASGIPATIFDAKGDIIAATAADTADRLAVGANGTVLTADSTTATGLKWATPESGSMTLLASGSISGTLNLTSISSSYKELLLYVIDFTNSSANSFLLRLNNDSGANYYAVKPAQVSSNAGQVDANNNATSIDLIANDFAANTGDNHLVLRIPNYTAAAFKLVTFESFVTLSGGTTYGTRMGAIGYKSSTAISQINLFNATSGTYELYGVK